MAAGCPGGPAVEKLAGRMVVRGAEAELEVVSDGPEVLVTCLSC